MEDILNDIYNLLEERLPKPEGVKPAPADDGLDEWERELLRPAPDDFPGEPVEAEDLQAGDRVAFTFDGERITCSLVSTTPATRTLRSDTPDKTGYTPNVTLGGREWGDAISDVRLIERAPREDEDPDEALAKALFDAEEECDAHTIMGRSRHLARTAREHIEAEGGHAAMALVRQAEDERDALRERLDALREDVENARRNPETLTRLLMRIAQALADAGLLVTPEHDAAVAAEWADHFEIRQGMVGPEPLTVESMIAALRGPRPFGCMAGESDD